MNITCYKSYKMILEKLALKLITILTLESLLVEEEIVEITLPLQYANLVAEIRKRYKEEAKEEEKEEKEVKET